MKKIIKTILLILIVIILVFLLHPISFFWNLYSKHVLLSDGILSDLQVQNNCTYEKSSAELSQNNYNFACLTTERFNKDAQKIEIDRMGKILENKGWQVSDLKNLNPWNITYHKNKLVINIQPFEWEAQFSGYQGTDYKLLIDYRDTTIGSWIQSF